MFFCPAVPYVVPTKMIDVISHLGLQSGLKLCLDAGDADSYTSGQKWLDRSGGGYDFFRGAGSGSEGSDPTFNGVAGGQSAAEYWGFDGGDFFTYDAVNESWMDSFHKTGAKFTILQWLYVSGATTTAVEFGNIGSRATSLRPGFLMGSSSSSLRSINVAIDNAAERIYSKISVAAANNNAWNMVGVSVDMAAGDVSFQINGTSESYTSQTFTATPSAAAAASKVQLGAVGGDDLPIATGGRVRNVAMWDVGLTAAQLAQIYSATRSTFGL